ncbi:uncharacterized protein BCR38DRAFT_298413, partial [Pseudomassariella vexata]
TLLLLAAIARLGSAHFAVVYPEWRADTLENEELYSQWEYPCGGVPNGVGNRTDWPISGGSVVLELHHAWTYAFINLGYGTNVSNFNVSLTAQLLNVTGSGTFCLPLLTSPDLTGTDGQNATIQVVTSGEDGSALYNCADITFRSGARALIAGEDECTNSTGVTAAIIDGSSASNSNSSSSSSTSSAGGNAAS